MAKQLQTALAAVAVGVSCQWLPRGMGELCGQLSAESAACCQPWSLLLHCTSPLPKNVGAHVAAGTFYYLNTGLASGGGGTGILGQGSDGVAASEFSTQGGGGGSGGADGANAYCSSTSTCGGAYGGGGGNGKGADGACRIIWGPGRAYPSTNTADQ